MLKISVKGSQDGSWGLTQGFKKNCDYHEAIDRWLASHGKKTIFCLVQFKDVRQDEMPRMYLATPAEIADVMKKTRSGNAEILSSMNITNGASVHLQQVLLRCSRRNGNSQRNEQMRCLIPFDKPTNRVHC